MIAAMLILCFLLVFILTARLRLIPIDRIDTFGLRVELGLWLMFLISNLTKRDLINDRVVVMFFIVLFISRILTAMAPILKIEFKIPDELIE